MKKKNDPCTEATLLMKYRGIAGYDPDNDVNFTVHTHLEFKSGQGNGWSVIAVPPDYENGKEDEPFVINDMLHKMIRGASTQDENITMIYPDDKNNDDDEDQDAEFNEDDNEKSSDDDKESSDDDKESSDDSESESSKSSSDSSVEKNPLFEV